MIKNEQMDFFESGEPDKDIEFNKPMARNTDPETSHQAARDAMNFATGNRLLVLQLLDEYGPLTDFELADYSGLQQNSIGKRRCDCFQAGLVEKHLNAKDQVETRPAPSGSKATVWSITLDGCDHLLECYDISTE